MSRQKLFYSRTFRRRIRQGAIVYAGSRYVSPAFDFLEGAEVDVTKFGYEVGTFYISQLYIQVRPFLCLLGFWCYPVDNKGVTC
ncbi:hypothetical protein [Methylomonas sp. DH-1]|uniref:hypothetical protein n=1 Tax=Methylomonas sp. (strain DH-1) TaxID=1727196 RepID=UPI0007C8E8CF|nr:hypothetical protein [Methylomonas sp. DH-1]ANE57478.1 hypothetical protein AYM39_21350 [Methylomonas sp. DH-1]